MDYYVYILASKYKGTLYIGVTSKLQKRIYEHKHKLIAGFTANYYVDKLVYYEQTIDVKNAIVREKQLKKWKREWKIKLIEKENPRLLDFGFPCHKEAEYLEKVLSLGYSVVIIRETDSYFGRIKQRLPAVKIFKQGVNYE